MIPLLHAHQALDDAIQATTAAVKVWNRRRPASHGRPAHLEMVSHRPNTGLEVRPSDLSFCDTAHHALAWAQDGQVLADMGQNLLRAAQDLANQIQELPVFSPAAALRPEVHLGQTWHHSPKWRIGICVAPTTPDFNLSVAHARGNVFYTPYHRGLFQRAITALAALAPGEAEYTLGENPDLPTWRLSCRRDGAHLRVRARSAKAALAFAAGAVHPDFMLPNPVLHIQQEIADTDALYTAIFGRPTRTTPSS